MTPEQRRHVVAKLQRLIDQVHDLQAGYPSGSSIKPLSGRDFFEEKRYPPTLILIERFKPNMQYFSEQMTMGNGMVRLPGTRIG